MAKSQIEILTEVIASLYVQLSASVARENELSEANAELARQLIEKQSEEKK